MLTFYGEVRGLRDRGGFEVARRWRGGVLQHATIRSLRGEPIAVRHGKHVVRVENLAAGHAAGFDGNLQRL